MSIVLFLSGVYYSAHADVQTDSAYIQLMSVKSTTSTDLKETVGSLTHLGYNLCTLKEGLWTKVFARPYEPLHLAQSNLKDLQQQYADAFIASPLSCYPFNLGEVNRTATPYNPHWLLGYGTWTQYTQGRVLVGQNSSNPKFNQLGEQGGSETHRLTFDELPLKKYNYNVHRDHAHSWYVPYWSYHYRHITYGLSGSKPHNNSPPYITVKIWRRIL